MKTDLQIGHQYHAMVSRRRVTVLIDGKLPAAMGGHWTAINRATSERCGFAPHVKLEPVNIKRLA